MSSRDGGRKKPVVEVLNSRFQSKKAEMEKEFVFDARPAE